jgi:hypothetical protein
MGQCAIENRKKISREGFFAGMFDQDIAPYILDSSLKARV